MLDKAGPVALVVDDEPCVLQFASTVLRSDGLVTLAACSVDEAIRLSRKRSEPIDVLVTDVQLGDGDGINLAEAIRHDRPGVAVLVISGAANQRARAQARGYAFLAKPFRLPAFREALRRVLPKAARAA